MTISEAIQKVLADAAKPLTPSEIHEAIAQRSLYSFKAKSPQSIVRAQLRRHCEGIDNKNSSANKLFRSVAGDRYELAGRAHRS